HPTVLRHRRNVKQLACSQLENATIIECSRRPAGEDQSDMLDMAACRPNRRADVLTPLPTRLIGSPPDSHPSEMHQLETPLLTYPHFIRHFEPLKDHID